MSRWWHNDGCAARPLLCPMPFRLRRLYLSHRTLRPLAWRPQLGTGPSAQNEKHHHVHKADGDVTTKKTRTGVNTETANAAISRRNEPTQGLQPR